MLLNTKSLMLGSSMRSRSSPFIHGKETSETLSRAFGKAQNQWAKCHETHMDGETALHDDFEFQLIDRVLSAESPSCNMETDSKTLGNKSASANS